MNSFRKYEERQKNFATILLSVHVGVFALSANPLIAKKNLLRKQGLTLHNILQIACPLSSRLILGVQ